MSDPPTSSLLISSSTEAAFVAAEEEGVEESLGTSEISDLVQQAAAPAAMPLVDITRPPPPLPILDVADDLEQDLDRLSLPPSTSSEGTKLRRLELQRLIKQKELEILQAEFDIETAKEENDDVR